MELSKEDLELLEIAKANKEALLKIDAEKEVKEIDLKVYKIDKSIQRYESKILDLKTEKRELKAKLKTL